MRNIWLVTRHELRTTLRQKSFWFFTLLMPAFLLAFQMYNVIKDTGPETSATDERAVEGTAGGSASVASIGGQAIGLVDVGGLIEEIPAGVPPDMFVFFPDESAAMSALEAGDVEQYVLVPADYIATGKVTVYHRNFQIRQGGENMGVAFGSMNEWMLRYILEVNSTGDEELVRILRNPVPAVLADRHVIRPAAETAADNQALARFVATALPYVYYFILIVVSGYLMRSVVAEKENRTVEVLLLSLRPQELMVGKMLAMSSVAWLQLLVWLGAGLLVLNRSSNWLDVSRFDFPPGFFVWALLFLVLGYLLYASIMSAAGAIAPNAREGGKVTWLLIVPLMPTMMFGTVFLEEPNGTVSLVLSLFPFSAPSAMVTRLAVAEVPFWQPLVSLFGLGITAYLLTLLAARFFRAGNLLSQASFSWRRLAAGWRE